MKKNTAVHLVLALAIFLGVHNGRVALWTQEGAEPAKVFPCPVSMLPADARAALEKGIRVESIEQLEQMAENYLS